MKNSTRQVYNAMRKGFRLSQGNGQGICGQTAISQRCSELINKHDIPVCKAWETAPSGARYRVYYLPPHLCDLKAERNNTTLVSTKLWGEKEAIKIL